MNIKRESFVKAKQNEQNTSRLIDTEKWLESTMGEGLTGSYQI